MTKNPFQGLLDEFLLESQERVARVEELLLQGGEAESGEHEGVFDEARRELHTLKGNAGMMGLTDLQSVAHALEDALGKVDAGDPDVEPLLELLDTFKSTLASLTTEATDPSTARRAAESGTDTTLRTPGSVRVPFTVLDSLVDLLAEMVIFRNRLEDAVDRGGSAAAEHQAWEEVEEAQEALGKTLGFIQDRVMALRMVPLQTLFGSLRRIVHDEAFRTGKEARLDTVGGDTPMDKAMLEVASEALGHLVRNAIAHGIEPPRARLEAGKAIEGTVRVTALVNANEIWIDVADDGAGIDRITLLHAAEERGISPGGHADAYDLLFQPGFSTRAAADIAAGRGIGLSAAAEAVERVGGRIEVSSEVGVGSRFRIRLPLSVSITRALLLRVDSEEYAMPLSSIIETLRFSAGDGHQMNNAGVFRWRGNVLPLVDLGFVNGSATAIRDRGFVAVIEADTRRRGVVVDDVTGIREIVVKALDATVGSPPGISGATILGDGRVVLILDPKGLVSLSPRLEPNDAEMQEVQP